MGTCNCTAWVSLWHARPFGMWEKKCRIQWSTWSATLKGGLTLFINPNWELMHCSPAVFSSAYLSSGRPARSPFPWFGHLGQPVRSKWAGSGVWAWNGHPWIPGVLVIYHLPNNRDASSKRKLFFAVPLGSKQPNFKEPLQILR